MSSAESNSPEENRLAEVAADWLARCDAGLSSKERAELARWISENPRHELAFKRIESSWAKMASLRGYRPRFVEQPDPDILLLKNRKRTRGFAFGRIAAVAAAVAIALTASFWSSSSERLLEGSRPQLVYSTSHGGYQRFTLADGSVVDLNGYSELQVLFSSSERKVNLVRGEAHFTVARNESVPFRVLANGIVAQAVGTAFNVKAAAAEVEILVTAGIVKLARAEATSLAPLAEVDSLTAGLRATVPVGGVRKPVVDRVSIDQIRTLLSWQSSRLMFVDMPLGEVLEQFNQRNTIQLSAPDSELSRMPIGGSFDSQNVEAFVRLLTSSGDIAAERTDENTIVLKRSR